MGAREHYFNPSNIFSLGFQTGLNLSLSVLMQDEKDEYGRFESILTDLMYLLRVPFEAENFDEEIEEEEEEVELVGLKDVCDLAFL